MKNAGSQCSVTNTRSLRVFEKFVLEKTAASKRRDTGRTLAQKEKTERENNTATIDWKNSPNHNI